MALTQNEHIEGSSYNLAGPWPWYSLLLTGMALTGLFPWIMLAWAFERRKRRFMALSILLPNLLLFGLLSWATFMAPLLWWKLILVVYISNFVWSLAAWIVQKKMLGSAPRRYLLGEWKAWIAPVAIGVILGISMATLFAVVPATQKRVMMWSSHDSLDRTTILRDFLSYTPAGALVGLLLGIWWAGEHRTFRASRIIAFLAAFALTTTIWILMGFLLFFLIHKGAFIGDSSCVSSPSWNVIPSWSSGGVAHLSKLHTLNWLALLIVPLFFTSVPRIRDFALRLLLIPLSFICLLPMLATDTQWWTGVQDQMIYELSSPNEKTRAAAHRWAELLLTRYPEHQQWPHIADKVAQYRYQQGQYEEAREFYHTIRERYQGSEQWHWTVRHAGTVLESPGFGKSAATQDLSIPLVDDESYLRANWMALLSLLRYWEGEATTESELKIRLKELSTSDDRIELYYLESLVDLDDAATNLGYELLLLPAEAETLKNLLSNGFPVLQRRYEAFHLIFGIDDTRGLVREYSFEKLSNRLKNEVRKETREILELEEEGRGKSRERLRRIRNEIYNEHELALWEEEVMQYSGPFIAAVFPAQERERLASALKKPVEELVRESDGFLAALIGLSYLEQADPKQALEWAETSAESLQSPLPLYIAHLAYTLVSSRTTRLKSALHLEEQFPELKEFVTYFNAPENIEFLDRARLRFETDLTSQTMPWFILDSYIALLDRDIPEQNKRIVTVLKKKLALNPAIPNYWTFLAENHEISGNTIEMVKALEGAISADPADFNAKLRLAYGYVLLERYGDAKALLQLIDSRQVWYNADYTFCLGAVAEWEGKEKKALTYYRNAIEMRRYTPLYHLKYGKLLLKSGENSAARKALEWAAKIDAGEIIAQKAQQLLATIP